LIGPRIVVMWILPRGGIVVRMMVMKPMIGRCANTINVIGCVAMKCRMSLDHLLVMNTRVERPTIM
jgi:ribosomal protein L34E